MSAEENKAIIRQFFEEGVNDGNLAVFDEFIATDYVAHFLPPELPRGPEGLKLFVGAFRAAFPDADVIAEEDKAASRVTFRGTQTGEFQGLPWTGKQVTLEVLDHWRFTGWEGRRTLGRPQSIQSVAPVGCDVAAGVGMEV